jgi:TRAP-type C4-dicarboxylate transport system permease small subunit
VDPLLAAARRLAQMGVWAGGLLLLLAAFLIGVEVLARRLLNISLGGVDDLAGFVLAVATTWALPLALLDRAHIRVDTLYIVLPRWVAALLDILGVLALIVFFAFVAWYGWGVMALSWRLGARPLSALALPLWIPQLLWVLGLLVFLLVATLLLVRAVILLVGGNVAGVRRLLGSRSIREETDEELRAARRRREGA